MKNIFVRNRPSDLFVKSILKANNLWMTKWPRRPLILCDKITELLGRVLEVKVDPKLNFEPQFLH